MCTRIVKNQVCSIATKRKNLVNDVPGGGGGQRDLREGTRKGANKCCTLHLKETYRRSGPRGAWVKISAVKRNPKGTDGRELPFLLGAATM